MKDVIADKLSAGESTQNIKDYFVQQYGPQVLGAPPLEGFNWLAWILPIVALVGGGYFFWSYTHKMVRKPTPGAATATPVAAGDPYSQELEKELKQYD
jgi:cytochrome c-type biogenesis protein CcmH